MKSSWKKQRQATKKRQIKLLRWRNNFVRKYGFKNVAELGIRVSETVRKKVDALYTALKPLMKMRITNENNV